MNTFVVTLDVPPGVLEQSIKGIPLFPLSLKHKCHGGSFNQTLLRIHVNTYIHSLYCICSFFFVFDAGHKLVK